MLQTAYQDEASSWTQTHKLWKCFNVSTSSDDGPHDPLQATCQHPKLMKLLHMLGKPFVLLFNRCV